jgi:hypothetical protein
VRPWPSRSSHARSRRAIDLEWRQPFCRAHHSHPNPSAWKPANLTFQCASADIPAQYRDVYERFGTEIVLASVRPNTVIGIPSDVTAWLQDAWIKIRSGHAGIDVPQLSQCDFELVLYKGV